MSSLTHAIMRRHVDMVQLVPEEEIVAAMQVIVSRLLISIAAVVVTGDMQLLWERMKIVVEPSGAVPLAAGAVFDCVPVSHSGHICPALRLRSQLAGKRVGIIISGGNIDLQRTFDMLTAEARGNTQARAKRLQSAM